MTPDQRLAASHRYALAKKDTQISKANCERFSIDFTYTRASERMHESISQADPINRLVDGLGIDVKCQDELRRRFEEFGKWIMYGSEIEVIHIKDNEITF